MSDDTILRAPWSEVQVAALNLWQARQNVHAYTCGGEHGEQRDRVLIATEEGWICRGCDFTQDWAHRFAGPGRRIAGALLYEEVEGLARYSRKFGYSPPREHVWHLIDTVRSARVEAESWRSTATDRGNKLVAATDKLEEVRRRVRVLLEAADLVDPSRYPGLEAAAEDLRSFAWPGEGEYRRRVEAESATGGGPVWVDGQPPPDVGA